MGGEGRYLGVEAVGRKLDLLGTRMKACAQEPLLNNSVVLFYPCTLQLYSCEGSKDRRAWLGTPLQITEACIISINGFCSLTFIMTSQLLNCFLCPPCNQETKMDMPFL